MVHEITEAADITEATGPIIVDFWAPWCVPCRSAAPHFARLAKDYPSVQFMKVNVEDYPEFATTYNVQSIPTFIVFKDGKEVNRIGRFDVVRIVGALNQL